LDEVIHFQDQFYLVASSSRRPAAQGRRDLCRLRPLRGYPQSRRASDRARADAPSRGLCALSYGRRFGLPVAPSLPWAHSWGSRPLGGVLATVTAW